MKIIFLLLVLWLFNSHTSPLKDSTYIGSTPANTTVRKFLGISLTDSIDFIRWKLVISDVAYQLQCTYGIGKPGTPGFEKDYNVSFSGKTKRVGVIYALEYKSRNFFIQDINANLVHLLDENKKALVGNGGWSYTLNSTTPVKTGHFNPPGGKRKKEYPVILEGRTPCQELSALMGREATAACNKMKWYIIMYTDSTTGKPSYFLEGGRGYRKETMAKGRWELIQKDDKIIYKLYSLKKATRPAYLRKAGDNIVLFTDSEGNPLVGNADFSYTLSCREDDHPVTR